MSVPAKRGRPPGPDRREAILEAALHCFVDRGFYGTAMPEIAKRAGVVAGTIYHYFESKEILVNTLFRSWKMEIAQRVFTKFPHDAGRREQFRVMWHEMIHFARENPKAFAFIELHNHASYLDDESRTVDGNLKAFAKNVIEQGQKEGLLKTLDATVLMELVFGAFVGMMRAQWEGRAELTDAIIEEAEQACWDAVSISPRTT
jgi:TetR/AcrR family transcriptional regulator, repressor of fatR-cypB operon